MEIFKMKIAEIDNVSASLYNKFKRILDKNKIKYHMSSSGKSFTIPEQTIISTNETNLLEITNIMFKNIDNLYACYENGALSIKHAFLSRLVIEHDIILDCFDDLDDDSIEYIDERLKQMSVAHRRDELNIYKFFAQKCTLPFEDINEILEFITFGSKEESHISMYESNRYAITQRTGYQKYLQ